MSEVDARIREADERAQRSGLAFALGKFTDYMATEAVAAEKRLEAWYANLGDAAGRGGDASQPIPAGDHGS